MGQAEEEEEKADGRTHGFTLKGFRRARARGREPDEGSQHASRCHGGRGVKMARPATYHHRPASWLWPQFNGRGTH